MPSLAFPDCRRQLFGALGIALFMLELAVLDGLTSDWLRLPALVPPFGASVVIVFLTPDSPAARPWNVIAGQTLSAFAAGVALSLAPDASAGVQAALAVALAGCLMSATRSLHPPGGATALLGVLLEPKLGFAMVLCPMLVGSMALVATRWALVGVGEALAVVQRGFSLRLRSGAAGRSTAVAGRRR